jgi:hypothetical protein
VQARALRQFFTPTELPEGPLGSRGAVVVWPGRHRLADDHPSQPTKWLVCPSMYQGCSAPSNIRHCGKPRDDGTIHGGCGCQVLVSLVMCPLVDSGELVPRCWDCQADSGQPVTMHDVERAELMRRGQLDFGWQWIGKANDWITEQQAEDAD